MSSQERPNLVLTGFMGTGKSTVGALLAERLGWAFIDTDAAIEAEAGMRIREIFTTRGEAAFRDLESEICRRAASQSRCVIATGGGALLNAVNRSALERTGVVVRLACDRHALTGRIEASALRGERPLLRNDFTKRVDELLKVREPVYASIPLQVDTTHLNPDEVADRVMELYTQAAENRTLGCRPNDE